MTTYNLMNLFLDDDGPVKPLQQVRPLARMIDQVGADLMFMQEVGSQASLEQLNQMLAQPYAHVACVQTNSDRGIHLGVFSRHPMQLEAVLDLPLADGDGAPLMGFASQSDAASATVTALQMARGLAVIRCRGLTLLGLHLKSKTNPDWQCLAADDIRAAEVRALCTWLTDHVASPLVILGDFNERINGDSLAPLKRLGLIDALGVQLTHQGGNPSTYWPKRRMRIDHILLSDDIQWRAPQIHANRMAQTASDHYPVSVTLSYTADE